MKYLNLLAASALMALPGSILGATVTGSDKKVITVSPEANTGLNAIFVVFDTSGCTLRYDAQNGYTTAVYRYSNLGGGYAEEVKDAEREASGVNVPLSSEDMGYIFEEGSTRYYCWVTNYANHVFTLDGVTPADEEDCSYSVLNLRGNGEAITYYTINGQPRVLSREIYVDYTTQELDKELPAFVTKQERKVFESIGSVLSITPPAYCSTYFTVTGDRFLREWGMERSAESDIVQPAAVDCYTEAVQEETDSEEGSNVMKGDSNGLGGSAPANISFIAYVTDAVIHYEWQMGRDQELANPEYRFYQQDLDYTFTEEGTYYLRFIGSNSAGTCETFGDVFTVTIGASALECPNAFSPNDDGVNDIWKVSYRSLIEFQCQIFNRNGQQIYSYNDPSGGWDGTWHGRKVKPGVYYYVIVATGADGKKYKKSGDINIINSVRYDSPSTTTVE